MERITIDSPASVQFDHNRDRVKEAVRGRAWLSKQAVIHHQTLVTRCLQVAIGGCRREKPHVSAQRNKTRGDNAMGVWGS